MGNRWAGAIFLLLLGGCAERPVSDEYREASRKEIQARRPDFKICYAVYGGPDPVTVYLKYQTNFSGEMTFVEVDHSRSNGTKPRFEDCMIRTFKEIRLPGEPQGTYGFYQIQFAH
jgi:hypothetical protein